MMLLPQNSKETDLIYEGIATLVDIRLPASVIKETDLIYEGIATNSSRFALSLTPLEKKLT